MPPTQPTTSTSGPATGGNPPPQSSSLPPLVSDEEAKYYYAGLSSGSRPAPILVARTGNTPWEMPTGPEAYHKPKAVRPGSGRDHPLREAMEDGLFKKLLALLDSMEVKRTIVEDVRIGVVEEYPTWFDPFPVILWIGVEPGSLSRSDGVIAAFKCREALVECGITDVDVEIGELVVSHWGPVNTGIYADNDQKNKKETKKKKKSRRA